MYKPLRIGQVHGLNLVFSALRPSVAIYISCLVLQTLLHTCTQELEEVSSWRHIVFHTAIFFMMTSGIWRAVYPLSKTDTPFLLTAVSLLVVAFLPPPAVSMQGSLCQAVNLLGAAERLARALIFSSVYTLFVYISSPTDNQYGGTLVCIMRAGAASVWTLGAFLPLLIFCIPQCCIAIWKRLRIEHEHGPHTPLFTQSSKVHHNTYNELPVRTPPSSDTNEMELNDDTRTALQQLSDKHDKSTENSFLHEPSSLTMQLSDTDAPSVQSSNTKPISLNSGPLVFRPIIQQQQQQQHQFHIHAPSTTISQERMAEIASSIENN